MENIAISLKVTGYQKVKQQDNLKTKYCFAKSVITME